MTWNQSRSNELIFTDKSFDSHSQAHCNAMTQNQISSFSWKKLNITVDSANQMGGVLGSAVHKLS